MAEMPSLYLLVWHYQDGAFAVSAYDDLDLACEAYSEAEPVALSVASACVDLGRSKPIWVPFSIETAAARWQRDMADEAREARRAQAKLRKDQAS